MDEFLEAYDELLGRNIGAGDPAAVAFAAVAGDGCGCETARVYISRLPEFVNMYSSMVREVFEALGTQEPDGPAVAAAMAKIASETGYGVDDLAKDIAAGEFDYRLSGDGRDADARREGEGEGGRDARDRETVDRWSRVSGRRMDVYEFLYYRDRVPSWNDSEIRDALSAQNGCYRECSSLHKSYFGTEMPEAEFVRRHLGGIAGEGFFSDFEAGLLSSREFAASCATRLASRYDSLFKATPHPDDVQHMLRRVRADKGGAGEELLARVCTDTARELEEYRERVQECYRGVLGRDCDEEECREWVERFRSIGPEAVAKMIEGSLYGSMEFVDVLKAALLKNMEADNGKAPSKRELYSSLETLIKKHGGRMREAMQELK